MRGYFSRQIYSTTAEAYALFWLRLGFTHAGFVLPRFLQFRGPRGKRPKWWRILRSFLPLFRVDVWAHTGQSGIRWLFRVHLFGLSVGYKLKGEARTPAQWRYSQTGFRVGWKGRNYGLRDKYSHA